MSQPANWRNRSVPFRSLSVQTQAAGNRALPAKSTHQSSTGTPRYRVRALCACQPAPALVADHNPMDRCRRAQGSGTGAAADPGHGPPTSGIIGARGKSCLTCPERSRAHVSHPPPPGCYTAAAAKALARGLQPPKASSPLKASSRQSFQPHRASSHQSTQPPKSSSPKPPAPQGLQPPKPPTSSHSSHTSKRSFLLELTEGGVCCGFSLPWGGQAGPRDAVGRRHNDEPDAELRP